MFQQIAFTKEGLTSGTHTIKIVCYESGKYVDLDGFLITNDDATLSNISVGCDNIPGFSPSVTSYNVLVPYAYPAIVVTNLSLAYFTISRISS